MEQEEYARNEHPGARTMRSKLARREGSEEREAILQHLGVCHFCWSIAQKASDCIREEIPEPRRRQRG